MAEVQRPGLRTWGEEIGLLWRRSWWLIPAFFVASWFTFIPGVQNFLSLLPLALVGLIVIWVVLVFRRMPHTDEARWRREAGRTIVSTWPEVATRLGLSVRSIDGDVLFAAIGRPSWEGWSCHVPVALPQGLGRDHLVAKGDLIAEAFGALECTIRGSRIAELTLVLEYADALAEPFTLEYGGPWDGHTVVMGRTSAGAEWRLRLGPHTLIAGSSGSGKASLVWGLLLGLAQPIREGVIEVWGIDRKGGMELAMGQSLLTRFASDAQRSVLLLEEAVEAMQARARQLAGHTRQHVATTDSPMVVVLIDELAALTAYEIDRDLMRRANAALATLASQGRAVGYMVFACLQDPRKETLPARGLFTQTVGLRLRDGIETAMVLGDGAVAAGAHCHKISPDSPGVAYVLASDGTPPERVRAGLITDDVLREISTLYPAPRQVPVQVPEASADSAPRSPRQSRRTSRKEDPS